MLKGSHSLAGLLLLGLLSVATPALITGAAIVIGVAIGLGVAFGTAPQPYGGTSGVVIAPILAF